MSVTKRVAAAAIAIAVALPVALGARVASAQGESDAERAAEDLFVRGRDAMLRGDLETGCPLLAESQRRDPRLGVLFTLAECEVRWGKGARAYAHYDAFLKAYARPDAMRNAANDERQRIAVARKASLAARVAFVTLVVPTPRPERLAATLNGEPMAEDALGAEVAVEPGDVTIAMTSLHAEEQRLRVTLAAGEHRTVMLAAPPPVRQAALPARVATPPARPARADAPVAATAARRSPWTYVPGAVGVAVLGASAVTGALVLAKKSDIDARCPDRRCDAATLDDVTAARTLGHVTTALAIAGAVGVTTTVVLLLTGPSPRSAAAARVRVDVAVVPTSLGATVSGTW